jgi:hypothetical protein
VQYVQYRIYTEGESEILSGAFSRFLSKEKASTSNYFKSLSITSNPVKKALERLASLCLKISAFHIPVSALWVVL